jgi:hypothetical protein
MFLFGLRAIENRQYLTRHTFTLQIKGKNREGVSLFPNLKAKYSTIIYISSEHADKPEYHGREMQLFADFGFAVVTMQFSNTNENLLSVEILELENYLLRQEWVLTNSICWVAVGTNANAALLASFSTINQPNLLVLLNRKNTSCMTATNALLIHEYLKSKLLLITDESVTRFEFLKTNPNVDIQTIPPINFTLRDDRSLYLRCIAEYCRQKMPLTDYGSCILTNSLTAEEVHLFNIAMMRAGRNRMTLLEGVTSLSEMEQRTAVLIIGRMEDYDLANTTSDYLRSVVRAACLARRQYPWTIKCPLDVFDRYISNPRVFDEPYATDPSRFDRRLRHELKYCHTTQEAYNAIFYWMHAHATWRKDRPSGPFTAQDIFDCGGGNCTDTTVLFITLARRMGIPARPTYTLWQHIDSFHNWTEIWDVETKSWRSVDCTAYDRPYLSDWICLKPKSIIYTTPSTSGTWNAINEHRWEALTNTVGLFYPSGKIEVTVFAGSVVTPNVPVVVQMKRTNMVSIARAFTDSFGRATFTLGQCYKYPYRVFIEQPGETDWHWVNVISNKTFPVTLQLENRRSFSPSQHGEFNNK